MSLLNVLTLLKEDGVVVVDIIKSIRHLGNNKYLCEYFDVDRRIDTAFSFMTSPDCKRIFYYNFGKIENLTELDELTEGKTIQQLEQEINFQLSMGESKGGTIVSHLVAQLEKLKK